MNTPNWWATTTPRKRKLVLWLIGLFIFYTVAGFFIVPPIVRIVAVKQLSKQLGREVTIQKVSLNPFTFSAAIRGLVIKETDGQPFVSWDEVFVNVQPTSIFRKAWTIKEIRVTKPYAHVKINEDGSFNFSDILARFPTNAAAAAPSKPSKPLAVHIMSIRVDGATANLENRKPASVAGSSGVTNNEPLSLALSPQGRGEGNVNQQSNVVVSAEAVTNAIAPNLLVLQLVTNAVAQLAASGQQLQAAIDDVQVTNCAIHLEDYANSRPAKLDLHDITFMAKNISNVSATNMTTDLSIDWNQNGSIKVSTAVSLEPLAVDVQLAIDRLDFGTLDPYLEPKLDLMILGSEFGLHGTVHVRGHENELPDVTFNGDVRLDGFRTVDGVYAEDLLKWDSVRVTGIDVNLNPETVGIKEIAVDNLYARAIIESNKTINLLNAMRITNSLAPSTNETEVAVATNSSAAPAMALPQITLGGVVISNATIHFSDRSLKPNVDMKILQAGGTISEISSTKLEHAVVDLHAIVDGVGPADITGTVNPFSETSTNEIKILVKDVDLTPTGPYSGKFAGYTIQKGKLNMDLEYEVVGKKLVSKNLIVLDQFTFGEHVDSPDATHLPVRLAIAILKDRQGKIILDVPIQGSLDDPKLRIGKVVKRTLLNILEKVATSPFSLIGAAFGGGGEELGWQEFDAGRPELTPDDFKKLDVLAKALYDRPALQLEIVGSVDSNGDREGLQRIALDRQIQTAIWMRMRKAEQATNSVDGISVSADERTKWVKKFYDKAVADGKITPDLLAANTNLIEYAAKVLPKKVNEDKGATRLMKSQTAKKEATNNVYQTKLVPPPDPTEAVLLLTYPVSDADLAALAAARAKSVENYLLQSGKVEASRLFIKQSAPENVRRDGSRVYLQFQ